jgi:hypothetical protein
MDLEKEYDNIHMEILWKGMKSIDINPILIEATINLYEKNTTRIKIGRKLMEEIQTTKVLDRVAACPLHCSKFIWTEYYKGCKGNVET